MTGAPYNPEDPEFLISCSLDQDLSDDQDIQVNEAVAASESLRREAEQLRKVHRLVSHWGHRSPELDWQRHEDEILARIADECGDPTELDPLLRQWACDTPEVEEDEFTRSVMARVESTDHRRPRHPMVLRLGIPLAAAAAIVVAVTASMWFAPSNVPIFEVLIGPAMTTVASPDREAGEPRVVVSFARRPVERAEPVSGEVGISFSAVGSYPLSGVASEAGPL